MKTPRWMMATYAIIIFAGILAALPNIFTQQQLAALPDWVPKQQLTLGLDLRGGSHLVLEVDANALKTDRLESMLAVARDLLREKRIQTQSARVIDGSVVIAIEDDAQRERAAGILADMAAPLGGAAQPDIQLGTQNGRIRMTPTTAGLDDRLNSAVEQSLEIVRQRVDQVGVAEPTIQRVGSGRLLVQLPGLQDPTRLRELLGSTAKMAFHMVAAAPVGDRPPAGVSLLPDAETGRPYPIENRVALDGERLTDARPGFDQRTNQPIVTFRFDGIGASRFAEITRDNVGRPFAIVLDGKVLSAPVINEPISGGSGQIAGSFSVEDTVVLSALLRAGALPAPLTVIEERTVGPDLGGNVIQMGLLTGAIGFALVALLMLVLYRGWE